jgi:hypothetical protein
MRMVIALLILLSECGCLNLGKTASQSIDQTIDNHYIEGLAGYKIDPCRATYGIIVERGEGAVPTVLKALDVYSGATNAPLRFIILNGASYVGWPTPVNAATINAVLTIMEKAKNDPDPEVRREAEEGIHRFKEMKGDKDQQRE